MRCGRCTATRWPAGASLLGDALYHDLIRPSGQVHVWEGDDTSPTEAIEQQIRDRHGIASQALTADDLRQMFPGIARNITRGLHVPGNGYTVSPQRIVRSLAELFRAAGGDIIAERAMKLIPRDGGGYMVMTNTANRNADHCGGRRRCLVRPIAVAARHSRAAGDRARLSRHAVLPQRATADPDQQQDARASS